jgi:hypothetical protein
MGRCKPGQEWGGGGDRGLQTRASPPVPPSPWGAAGGTGGVVTALVGLSPHWWGYHRRPAVAPKVGSVDVDTWVRSIVPLEPSLMREATWGAAEGLKKKQGGGGSEGGGYAWGRKTGQQEDEAASSHTKGCLHGGAVDVSPPPASPTFTGTALSPPVPFPRPTPHTNAPDNVCVCVCVCVCMCVSAPPLAGGYDAPSCP